jgi:hypothetical protein
MNPMTRIVLACVRRAAPSLLGVLALACVAAPAGAQDAVTLQLSVKNQRFEPAEISAPAGKRIAPRIKNLDAKPVEFESVTLRVEKVIAGNSEGVVNIRALEPGRYKFLDDFNPKNQGVLAVR